MWLLPREHCHQLPNFRHVLVGSPMLQLVQSLVNNELTQHFNQRILTFLHRNTFVIILANWEILDHDLLLCITVFGGNHGAPEWVFLLHYFGRYDIVQPIIRSSLHPHAVQLHVRQFRLLLLVGTVVIITRLQ